MKKHTFYAVSTFILSTAFIIPAVSQAATITIGAITPSSQVPASSNISFQISNADYSTNPRYIVSDSFPGSTLASSNINSAGVFSWTPSPLDVGTHNLTITGVDSYNNTNTIYQTIIVEPPSALSIQNLSPGSTLNPSNNDVLTFSVGAAGYVNPTFYVTDSFSGSSITSSNITSDGNFSWKPTKSDAGVHNLAIRVSSTGRTDVIYETVTVDGLNIQMNSDAQVLVGSPLSFTVNPYGLNSPTYTVTDSAPNNTIENINISGNSFTWTPEAQDIGTHTLDVRATDINGVYADTPISVYVQSNNTATVTTAPAQTTTSTYYAPTVTKTYGDGYFFNKNLQVGSMGTAVTELQKRLTFEGVYTGPITGTFGPLTKAGVARYQTAKGISSIGIAGPATRASLNAR